jgi:hypothetical protein
MNAKLNMSVSGDRDLHKRVLFQRGEGQRFQYNGFPAANSQQAPSPPVILGP